MNHFANTPTWVELAHFFKRKYKIYRRKGIEHLQTYHFLQRDSETDSANKANSLITKDVEYYYTTISSLIFLHSNFSIFLSVSIVFDSQTIVINVKNGLFLGRK